MSGDTTITGENSEAETDGEGGEPKDKSADPPTSDQEMTPEEEDRLLLEEEAVDAHGEHYYDAHDDDAEMM